MRLVFLGQKKVLIDENFLSEHIKYNAMKSEMEKAVTTLKNNYIKNLSLRSSTGIHYKVNNYILYFTKVLV